MADADQAKRSHAGEPHLVVLGHTEPLLGGGPLAERVGALASAFAAHAVAHPTVAAILQRHGAVLRPLFSAGPQAGGPAQAVAALAAGVHARMYHRVIAAEQHLEEIARALRLIPEIEAAYVKPRSHPPAQAPAGAAAAAAPPAPPGATQDFSTRQAYLDAAPDGIDARFAWSRPGGKGTGVDIIDVEGEWQLSHEDLRSNSRGLLGGTPPNDPLWRDHGTAVVGICIGSDNGQGVTGICPEARVGMVSQFGPDRTSSSAIRDAADLLQAGDILLIELHFPGPKHNFQERDDEDGYIAVEWWPDDFDAIRHAVERGVIVVEAAGNGAQDLDANIFQTAKPGFPPDWKNPFRRQNRDSGAILVGAGAPPSGMHGPDRSRLSFSNFGSAVDAQGWGREVTTCGYGDLQHGPDENRWYTKKFAGTSSASPMVVGALACLQGIRRASGAPLLTPASARALLRATGTRQEAALGFPSTQRIGNRPDLRSLVEAPIV
jgi:hypothetical protein